MPNWAMGDIEVVGNKTGLAAFIRHFISDDDSPKTQGSRFFGRCFIDCTRAEIEAKIEKDFNEKTDSAQAKLSTGAMFAWSADSCLISYWPKYCPDQCISLVDACIEDKVAVTIRTFEPGMCFEELITCTADGQLSSECTDMKVGQCNHCGATQSIASFEDLDDVECFECGETGFTLLRGEE